MPKAYGRIQTSKHARCIKFVQGLSSSPHGSVQRQDSCSWPGSAQGLHQQDLYVAFGRLSCVQASSPLGIFEVSSAFSAHIHRANCGHRPCMVCAKEGLIGCSLCAVGRLGFSSIKPQEVEEGMVWLAGQDTGSPKHGRGMGVGYTSPLTCMVATPCYRAPEVRPRTLLAQDHKCASLHNNASQVSFLESIRHPVHCPMLLACASVWHLHQRIPPHVPPSTPADEPPCSLLTRSDVGYGRW